MKIVVDFNKKTLTLDSEENLGKFFDKITQMFPENAWKEFTLITNSVWYSYPNITYTYYQNSLTVPKNPAWNPTWVISGNTTIGSANVSNGLIGQCVIETD